MGKLTFAVATLLVAVTFASQSFADWTEVGANQGGDTYYVDFDRIRKSDGYIYFWNLSDYREPNELGVASSVVYKQGDCNVFRYKYLRDTYYKTPMGRGNIYGSSNVPDKEWRYATPYSMQEIILEAVCSH